LCAGAGKGSLPDQSVFCEGIHIICPLTYLQESLLKKYATEQGLPVVESSWPSSKSSRRVYIKQLLKEFERDNKNIYATINSNPFPINT